MKPIFPKCNFLLTRIAYILNKCMSQIPNFLRFHPVIFL